MLSKKDMLASIVDDTKLSKGDVEAVLDSLTKIIATQMAAGNEVVIPGLAKFKTRNQKAKPERTTKSPSTGKPITIKAKPACSVVSIKPLKFLKDAASNKSSATT